MSTQQYALYTSIFICMCKPALCHLIPVKSNSKTIRMIPLLNIGARLQEGGFELSISKDMEDIVWSVYNYIPMCGSISF